MDFKTLAQHLPEIAPKRVILTHMSPDMLKRVAGLAYETAEDGKTIEL